MAQLVRSLADKPEYLSSVPWTHMIEGRKGILQVALWPPLHPLPSHPYTYMQKRTLKWGLISWGENKCHRSHVNLGILVLAQGCSHQVWVHLLSYYTFVLNSKLVGKLGSTVCTTVNMLVDKQMVLLKQRSRTIQNSSSWKRHPQLAK